MKQSWAIIKQEKKLHKPRMSKKNKRKYLERTAKTPPITTQIIDPSMARQLPIIFGFSKLIIDKKPFNCSPKNADGLLHVIKLFHHFSKVLRIQVDSFPNCHLVPDNQIKKHNLSYFVSLAPNRKLHQLGRRRTKQRVVGYYDTPRINLFQVCLLDLNHKLSGN